MTIDVTIRHRRPRTREHVLTLRADATRLSAGVRLSIATDDLVLPLGGDARVLLAGMTDTAATVDVAATIASAADGRHVIFTQKYRDHTGMPWPASVWVTTAIATDVAAPGALVLHID